MPAGVIERPGSIRTALLLIALGLVATTMAMEFDRHDLLLGQYETALAKTGEDRGALTRHPTQAMRFRWTNESGTFWDLKPNIANGVLEAKEGASNILLHFAGRPGESSVQSIRINGRLYFRKPTPGEERRAVPSPGDPSEPAPAGKVTQVNEHTFEVGEISIDKTSSAIAFDATVNQVGGPIEYLLVTDKGKTHESLFACDIRPIDLNVAFLLLDYQPSPELFEIRTPDHRPTGKFPAVAEDIRSRARLRITVAWTAEGETQSAEVNEFIKNEETGKPMAAGPWLYTGSAITPAGFRAEHTGDIMAVFFDPGAMVNHPGEGRRRDDIWSVRPGPLPPKGSRVKITITPFLKGDESSPN